MKLEKFIETEHEKKKKREEEANTTPHEEGDE